MRNLDYIINQINGNQEYQEETIVDEVVVPEYQEEQYNYSYDNNDGDTIPLWNGYEDDGYCNNCGYCSKTVGCRLKDDMTDLYKHFDESISTIVVSPVAFDGPMAKFKTLVDRTNMLFHSKYTLKTPAIDRNKKRVGYFIQVAGSEHYPTQFLGGDVIGGFFFKAINTKLEHELHIGNTDEVNPIEDKNTMLRIKSSLEAYIWDVLLLTKSEEV